MADDLAKVLQSILDHAPIGVWMQDANGRLRFVNRTFCAAVGIPEERFLAAPHYAQLYDEATARSCMTSDREALAQASPHTSMERIRFVDGQIHDLEIVKVRLTGEDGRIEGLIGLSADVTARRLAEAALRRQQEGLHRLNEVASAPGADPREALRRALQVGAQHLGLELGMIGRIVGDRLVVEVQAGPPGPLADGMLVPLEETFCTITIAAGDTTGIPDVAASEHRDHPARRRFGTAAYLGVPLRVGGAPFGALSFSAGSARPAGFDDADHEFVRLLARWVEPTLERWAAERRLRESEARLAGVVDSAMDGIITLDEAGQVVLFNSAAEAMFGCRAAEIIGRPMDCLLPERFRAAHREHVREFLATGRTNRAMGRLSRLIGLRAGGEEFPCQASISRVEVGGRVLVTAIMRDVTEHVRAERAQRALEARVRQAEKMEAIGRLAGGIAHDFNNILNVVLANAEFALPVLASAPEAAESLEAILQAGTRARHLVRRILTFSRKMPQRPEELALAAVLEEAARFMRAILPAGIELRTGCGAQVPRIWADPTDLHQVLVNLCTNAWHAIEDGRGCIDVRIEGVTLGSGDTQAHPELRPGRYGLLTVSDTGCGMDAATRERIFEPFFTTKAVGEGTGLGLSMVHGIVKQMGGSIEVTSEPGQGSSFRVFLPASEAAARAQDAGGAGVEPAPGGGARVLYVDDEPDLVRIATRALERSGFQVTGLTRPEQALAAVREAPERFAAMLADANMPGMSGLDLVRAVRQLRPGLPVALVTGHLTEPLAAAAADLDVAFVLEKPYTVSELREAVAGLVEPAARTG